MVNNSMYRGSSPSVTSCMSASKVNLVLELATRFQWLMHKLYKHRKCTEPAGGHAGEYARAGNGRKESLQLLISL